ncbi:MAG: aminopeptidase P family protein [Cyclobacteriaceae bacterium]|nr:aminopeptidase P family protein [Cyclobacteriaceae bacterium]
MRSICLPLFLSSAFLTFAQTPKQPYFDWTNLPFPAEEYEQRRVKMLGLINDKGIFLCPSSDGLSHGETFRQLDDFNYFTGLEVPNSMLVLDGYNKKVILFLPKRDFRFENGSRKNDFPGRDLLADDQLKYKTGISDFRDIETLDVFIASTIAANKSFFIDNGGGGNISFLETSFISSWSVEQMLIHHLQQKFQTATLQNAYPLVAELRMVKSTREIEMLRKAADITMISMRVAAKSIKPGVDERTLEAELEAEFKRQGSPRLPFASIIKSGPNSLWPWRILAAHYDRRNRKMNAGELVIFDVGCEYNYYVSDMGRTFPVSGKFSEEQKRILKMEIAVSDAIVGAIRPGITFADLKAAADKAIPDSEKKYMQVGLHFGHHLGMSSGDPNSTGAKLVAGMWFTVEPWYYNHDKDISVFTEDEVLVTEDGYELITKSLPRTPEGLEKLMKEK